MPLSGCTQQEMSSFHEPVNGSLPPQVIKTTFHKVELKELRINGKIQSQEMPIWTSVDYLNATKETSL